MSMRHVLALILLLACAGPVHAHAFLDHTVPPVGGIVATSLREVRLFFTQELEPHFSGATLSTADGRPIATSAVSVDPQNPMAMVLSVPPLAPGRYKVSWHAVSVDTHRTEGDFTFEVRP
jgi:methionine-rich copper-binding protein CopC